MKIRLVAHKRVIRLSIVIGLLTNLLSLVATPANAVVDGTVACSGGGTFTISNNVITSQSGCTGSIGIPEGVTGIAAYAFKESQVTGSVVIPDSVTSIGIQAFFAANGITSLVIGSGITSIPDSAFDALYRLNSLTLPNTLISIGVNAFWYTRALTSLTIPASVSTISEGAFGDPPTSRTFIYCGNASLTGTGLDRPGTTLDTSSCLTVISNPEISGVTAPVGGATPVTSVTAANGYTGTVSWSGTLSAEGKFNPGTIYTATITLTPVTGYTLEGVVADFFTIVGTSERSTNLINSGVITSVFHRTTPSLFNSTTGNGAVECGSAGHFNIQSRVVTSSVNCQGVVEIPSGVTGISNEAFLKNDVGEYSDLGASGITELIIGNDVVSIGDNAFELARLLGSLTIGSKVEAIGDEAFKNAYLLDSLTIPNSVKSIGDGAFRNAQELRSLVIGNSVRSIGARAFETAEGLSSVDLPDSVITIGAGAFGETSDSLTLNYCGPESFNKTTIGLSITASFGCTQSTIATLSSLIISAGSLSPTFATGTYSYTASVLSETSTVTVTPTRTQANATIQVRVNSGSYASVTSGFASGSLAINVGSNTINVLVTAQNGSTTATYIITVTRPAPTPSIAIGTTSFTPRVATNVGVALTGFDETLSYLSLIHI